MQPVIANGIYLEDIRVGDVFESEVHQLDAEQIVQFASQFDRCIDRQKVPASLLHVASPDPLFGGSRQSTRLLTLLMWWSRAIR